MSIKIEIPTPLRVYTENLKKIELQAENVEQAMKNLILSYPKLGPHLFEGDKIRSFVNIYLNDEDIRFLEDKMESELKNGDILSIIPSIAGGSFD